METAKESLHRILRSRAFLFLIVVMIIMAIVAAALGGGDGRASSDLSAKAAASTDIARTGEEIVFSAEGSKGNIESFRWDLGDGTSDNGTEISHAFETGGWFNVTLVVTSGSGKNASDTVTVGIQPEDMHNTRDLGRERDVRPLWLHGYGLLGDVGPHIAPPVSTLEYDVIRGFGTFSIYVEVWVYDGDVYQTQELHREEMTLTGQDLRFSYTVEPGDLPPEASTNYTRVHISTMIDQGRWASSEIRVDVEFPSGNQELEQA